MGSGLIKTENVINAPAERVWAEMTDFASFPDWNPFVRKAQGRLELEPLISHVVAVEDVADAFRLLDERPDEAVQVVLDFS